MSDEPMLMAPARLEAKMAVRFVMADERLERPGNVQTRLDNLQNK